MDNKGWKALDKKYHEDDHVVASYERRITRKFELEHKYFTVDKWIKEIVEERADLALDFGCGTGAASLKLLSSGIKTISCDASLGMLKKLKEQAEAGNLKCLCVAADVENLPFKDACFSALICAGVLHHLPEPLKALREQLRVLKNKGLLFISEPFKTRPWFSYIYWLPVDLIRAIIKFLRGKRRETLERPLEKSDIGRISSILKNNTGVFDIVYLIYWPFVGGYLPESIAYPFMAFLNRINNTGQKGDTVIIAARK